jgi:hypothetical protein
MEPAPHSATSTSRARLLDQRCFNHATREAAARCPECRRFYCRECVTEHEDRVLCATCLRRRTAAPRRSLRWLADASHVGQALVGVFLAWLFFYWLGLALLRIDPAYHELTVWRERWWEE